MKRLIKHFGEPSVLTTDKAPALLCACKKVQKDDYYIHTKHCIIKHCITPIEQDYQHVKHRLVKAAGLQTLCHVASTIKGSETIQAIYK